MAHAGIDRGGNGNPPGIRISWVALGSIVTLLALIFTGVNGVRSTDMRLLRQEIGVAHAEALAVDRARLEDKKEMTERLARMEEVLEAIRAEQIRQAGGR